MIALKTRRKTYWAGMKRGKGKNNRQFGQKGNLPLDLTGFLTLHLNGEPFGGLVSEFPVLFH